MHLFLTSFYAGATATGGNLRSLRRRSAQQRRVFTHFIAQPVNTPYHQSRLSHPPRLFLRLHTSSSACPCNCWTGCIRRVVATLYSTRLHTIPLAAEFATVSFCSSQLTLAFAGQAGFAHNTIPIVTPTA